MLSFAAHYFADSGGEVRQENTLTPRKVSIFADRRNAVHTLDWYSILARSTRKICSKQEGEAYHGGDVSVPVRNSLPFILLDLPAWATSDPRESVGGERGCAPLSIPRLASRLRTD